MTIQAQIKPGKKIPDTLYLLSELKGGKYEYAGRTTDTKNALYFAEKTKAGKMNVSVHLCTETSMTQMSVDDLHQAVKKENRAAGQLKRKQTLTAKKLESNNEASKLVQQYGSFA